MLQGEFSRFGRQHYHVAKVVRSENVAGCIKAGQLLCKSSLVMVVPEKERDYRVTFTFTDNATAAKMEAWEQPGGCEEKPASIADAIDQALREGRF